MPRWTEENRVWASLVEAIKSMKVDDMVMQETDRPLIAQATARRVAIERGFKVHSFKHEPKIYFIRVE